MKRILSFLRFLLKWIVLPIVILVLSILAFSYYYYDVGYKSVNENEKITMTDIPSHSSKILTDSGSERRTGNTFMSIPEWYIVTISEDYTEWMENRKNPSDFPYFSYLTEYWKLYGRITAFMDGNFPRDYEYHTMVQVIGVSTTLEFGLKGLYEKTVGRLTSFFGYQSNVDTYYKESSRRYVNFILYQPWYLFDYTTELNNFHLGDMNIRSLERYVFYGFEFFMKKHYAKVIENATRNTFAVPDPWTFVAGNFSSEIVASGALIDSKLTKISSGGISIQRYYPFTKEFPKILISSGANIASIAGNTYITVEMLGNTNDSTLSEAYIQTPDLIHPGNSRYFLLTPVNAITKYIGKYQIEHIYDF